MNRNWKTTLGGIITAVGLALTAAPNPPIHIAGLILAGIGALFTGTYAKDRNVTGGTVTQPTVENQPSRIEKIKFKNKF